MHEVLTQSLPVGFQTWIYTIPAALSFVLALVAFWQNKPPTPPSPSTESNPEPFLKGIKQVHCTCNLCWNTCTYIIFPSSSPSLPFPPIPFLTYSSNLLISNSLGFDECLFLGITPGLGRRSWTLQCGAYSASTAPLSLWLH